MKTAYLKLVAAVAAVGAATQLNAATAVETALTTAGTNVDLVATSTTPWILAGMGISALIIGWRWFKRIGGSK